jgi:hypothetical protein
LRVASGWVFTRYRLTELLSALKENVGSVASVMSSVAAVEHLLAQLL